MRGRPLLAGTAAVVAVFALSPIVHLTVRVFEGGTGAAFSLLFRQRTLDLAVRTLVLTLVVALGCLIVGVLAAWLVTRTDLPGRRFFAVALAAPLAIPSYVAAYVWIAEFPVLAGLPGAALVLIASCFPLVMLPVAAAFASADPGVSEVSRTLGRNAFRTAWTVEARGVVPAAAAGTLLASLYTISDFGAVALMRYDAFTLGVYSAYRGGLDRTVAAVLGLVLVVIATVLTLLERRLRRGATARTGSGVSRVAEPIPLRRWVVPAWSVVLAVLTVSVLVPMLGLVRWMIHSLRFTIAWRDVLTAMLTTIQYATAAAVVVVVLAVPVAVYVARTSSPVGRAAETAVYIAHGLPGITVGLAVVFFGIRFLPAFYQTAVLLIVAYAVLFLPLAVGPARAAIVSTSAAVDDVSRTLGSGPARTDRRVTLPLALPGIAAGAALVFLTVAKELPATLMLRPRGADTLATELWSATQVLKYGEAAPYALALVLVSVVPTIVLDRAVRRRSVPVREAPVEVAS
ncbi:ABC transporter permease [Rhodococcus yananensis]|uniref:ABC transporter permease n=1 Tax=Rhodococcus yananensis TaxID=2879464 RepID=UPI001CF8C6E0|nr:iron ABC transporter permease [Rhodococcus yananensis]